MDEPYSNPKNKPEDRIEFLEETLRSIVYLLEHMGADFSDRNKRPLEQTIAREYAKIKYNK